MKKILYKKTHIIFSVKNLKIVFLLQEKPLSFGGICDRVQMWSEISI